MLQPLRVDLQAVPVLVQGEQVNIANALLLFLQQRSNRLHVAQLCSTSTLQHSLS